MIHLWPILLWCWSNVILYDVIIVLCTCLWFIWCFIAYPILQNWFIMPWCLSAANHHNMWSPNCDLFCLWYVMFNEVFVYQARFFKSPIIYRWYFDWNCKYIYKKISIDLDNGLTPNRRQAITWSIFDPHHPLGQSDMNKHNKIWNIVWRVYIRFIVCYVALWQKMYLFWIWIKLD